MASQRSSSLTFPAPAWTARERILAELVSHGIAVPDLDPTTRFVAIIRLTADYRPLARAFQRLDAALRWLQQTESEHAVVDVIVDLGAPSLEGAAIRPFHVLTTDDTREPLDLSGAPATSASPVAAQRALGELRPPKRRPRSPRLVG